MSHKEDCYFFFTSACNKGDNCRFRHCEAAMGSKVVCRFWLQNRCLNNACRFRHTDIKNIRKEVECHWEKQPRGCRKQYCTFKHLKPRPVGQRPVRLAKTSEKWMKPDDATPDQRMKTSGCVYLADAERHPCRRAKNIRKEVESRWERHPRGCRKQYCTFKHLKPRPVGQRPVRLAKTSEKWMKPDVTPDQRMKTSGRVYLDDAERRPCRCAESQDQGRRKDCNRVHPVLPAKDDEIDFIIRALEELKLEDSVNMHIGRAESHLPMDFKWSPVTHTSSNARPNLKRSSELNYLNGEPPCKRAKI